MSFQRSPNKVLLFSLMIIVGLSVSVAVLTHRVPIDESCEQSSQILESPVSNDLAESQTIADSQPSDQFAADGPAIGSVQPLQESELECLAEQERAKDEKYCERIKQNLIKAPGFIEAQKYFSLDRMDGIVQDLLTRQAGELRTVHLQVRSPSVIDSVEWTITFNDLKSGKSTLNWRELLSTYKSDLKLVSQLTWLENWKVSNNATIELSEFPFTSQEPNAVSQDILEAWHGAKFAGRPKVICRLIDPKDAETLALQQLALSPQESRTLLINDVMIQTRSGVGQHREFVCVLENGSKRKI